MYSIGDVTKRIRGILDKNKKNGVQLGVMLGLKKSPLTDWKNNKSKPTLDQIVNICNNFSVSSDYILFGKKDYNEFTEDEIELLDNYRNLDSRGKHKLQTVIYDELDRIINCRS